MPKHRSTKIYTDFMVNDGHDGSMMICPYRDHRKAGLKRFYTDWMVNNGPDANMMICSYRYHRKAGLKFLATTDLTLDNVGLNAPQSGIKAHILHSVVKNLSRNGYGAWCLAWI
jgi:hypothetical protein